MESSSRNTIARDIEEGKNRGRYKDCVHLFIGEPGPYGSGTFHTMCEKQAFEYLQKAHPMDRQPRCPQDCHFFSERKELESSKYDIALICENGHVVNSSSRRRPEDNTSFCEHCGAKTIEKCQSCEGDIRGYDWGSGVIALYVMPSYCSQCGEPFPWTMASLKAAEELIRLNQSLNDEEKEGFIKAIEEAAKDSPKGKVAAEEIKVYGKKIGTKAYNLIINVVSDVLSETLKKQMGL